MRSESRVKVFGGIVGLLLFTSAATAQNPPPVQFTPGYPAVYQPVGFLWFGRVDVLGTYSQQVAGLGTASNFAFMYVPQAGGTVNTTILDGVNGTFGAANANGVGPKPVTVPAGKWNGCVTVLYARQNPNFQPGTPGSPPTIFTPVMTNVVAFEIK
jgi:hypothetical protein